jgi:cell wall assembly regulator SMI1
MLVAQLELLGVVIPLGGASEQEISSIEKEIGVVIPQSYRYLLATYNVSDLEIDFKTICDLSHLRSENIEMGASPYLKKMNLIAFATDNNGNNFCFDMEKIDSNGEPLIIFFDHDTLKKGPVVNSDFNRFLISLIILKRELYLVPEEDIEDADGNYLPEVRSHVYSLLKEADSVIFTDYCYWDTTPIAP